MGRAGGSGVHMATVQTELFIERVHLSVHPLRCPFRTGAPGEAPQGVSVSGYVDAACLLRRWWLFLSAPSPSLPTPPPSPLGPGQAWRGIRAWASAPWDAPRYPLTGLSVAAWAWGPFPQTLPAGPARPRRDTDPTGPHVPCSWLPRRLSSDRPGGLGGQTAPPQQPQEGGQGAAPGGPFFPSPPAPPFESLWVRVLRGTALLRMCWGLRARTPPPPP